MASLDMIHQTGTDADLANLVTPGYTPAAATNVALWLKADAQVTTTLGHVTGWVDQTSVGANATVPALNSGPTVTSSWRNGLPGITFDGATQGLTIPLNLSAVSQVAVYMVLQGTSAGLLSMTLEHSVNSALNTGFGIGLGGNGPATCVLTNGPPSVVDTQVFALNAGSPLIFDVALNRTTGVDKANVGGVPATVTPLVPGVLSGNYASANLYIANRGGGLATCWGGTIGEIIVLAGPSKANTYVNTIAYLQNRWGLSS